MQNSFSMMHTQKRIYGGFYSFTASNEILELRLSVVLLFFFLKVDNSLSFYQERMDYSRSNCKTKPG